ncbi:MAG: serine/threonine-protein kinase PknK, partial [Chloroflexaceae bacterium]|nr:serine/threonine-protein kinase PknK [Chloroflexaceae bacterium]
MQVVAGYGISRELYASLNSVVYRAHRQVDGQSVILKLLREVFPSPDRLAWFRREYDLTRSLAHLPGVVHVYSLEQHPAGWMLVLQDIGGDSLANLGLAGNLALPDFLRLAIALTRILGSVHQQQVIHKDLNPNNIIYNSATDQLCLIDFGLATRLSRETTSFRSAAVLEGTLPYLAPEQTGRMNRAVDYRSDFYSLGVTFYELITGQVPFISDDPLELVHSHIARPPVPPHVVNPAIPVPLSEIVLKLLAKDADARYQSAYGLQADLEHCLRELTTTGTIAPFLIGQHDIADHFALPQKLYGRETELATLLDSFVHAAAGERSLLLVAGAPGIGKTALVQEVYRPLTERRGTFISGKFDQVQRSSPYLAFAQAFRGLMRQILTEPEAVLVEWREQLTAALGVNGQVIVEVIPDLELVIGAQPEVPALGPQEAQNRFVLVFQNFLRVFTRADHPLVLFLDDLQWADSGSLKLLEQVLSDPTQGHLFIIGAYRDTEVPPGHALWGIVQTITQAGVAPQTLTLDVLTTAAVAALVQDALHVESATATPLAALMQQKTGGNPFFVGQFLKALYNEGLLRFDGGRGRWTWDIAQLEARQMTDNVVALLTEQVQRLPAATQQALQRAACIGNRFDLAILAAVEGQAVAATVQHLEPALLAGLVEPLGDGYKVIGLEVEGLAAVVQAEYRFAHDRIQQAAYEQVAADERAAQHWRIGRRLLERAATQAAREAALFDIVSQLNAGRALANADERRELAMLNLTAGQKARESAAFGAAYEYLQVGLELLPDDGWATDYPLALALHDAATQAAYLSGDYDGMERLVEVVLTHARDALDTVTVYEARIQAAIGQGQMLQALQTGLEGLRLLGVVLPEHPDEQDVGQAIQTTQALLQQQPIEDLIDLPLMTDAALLSAVRILRALIVPSLLASPMLFAIVASKMVEISITNGNAPESFPGYATYGTLAFSALGDSETAYQCGALGLHGVERFQARSLLAFANHMFNLHCRVWKEHLRGSIAPFRENIQIGQETGSLDWAGYACVQYGLLSYFTGRVLDDFAPELPVYHVGQQRMKQIVPSWWVAMLIQVIANLQGTPEHPTMLAGEWYDEHQMLPTQQDAQDGYGLYFFYLHKLLLSYLFDELDQYAEYIAQV